MRIKDQTDPIVYIYINNLVILITLINWGGRTRTYEWRIQSPLPYHLATPQGTLKWTFVNNKFELGGIRTPDTMVRSHAL